MFLGDSLISNPHWTSNLWNKHGHQALAGGGAMVPDFFGITTKTIKIGGIGAMRGTLQGRTFNGIVILLGANDISCRSPEEILENYRQLLEELSGACDVPIFVLKVFPINQSYVRSYGWNVAERMERTDSFNSLMEQYLRETGIACFVDATANFTDENGLLVGDSGDGLHISPLSYDLFYQSIEEALYATGLVVPVER